MQIIPAIDIMDGKCTRLVQGDPRRLRVYSSDPLEIVRRLKDQGAELVHVIDLNAALGSGENLGVIEEILDLHVRAQIGGGVRTLEKAEALLKLGALRVIFGTVAIENPRLIEKAVHRYGSSRIAVAIDEERGKAVFHGWKDKSGMGYLDLANLLEAMKVGAIIFTSTSHDGTMEGLDMRKIERLVGAVKVPIIASGGVGSLNDLIALAKFNLEGVIVGTALYEGKFSLKQALEAVKNVS